MKRLVLVVSIFAAILLAACVSSYGQGSGQGNQPNVRPKGVAGVNIAANGAADPAPGQNGGVYTPPPTPEEIALAANLAKSKADAAKAVQAAEAAERAKRDELERRRNLALATAASGGPGAQSAWVEVRTYNDAIGAINDRLDCDDDQIKTLINEQSALQNQVTALQTRADADETRLNNDEKNYLSRADAERDYLGIVAARKTYGDMIATMMKKISVMRIFIFVIFLLVLAQFVMFFLHTKKRSHT